jgi:dGTPase
LTRQILFEARVHTEQGRKDDVRTEYERDKARIIHSAGFRRLQGKTQVMGVGEGDFHRTRLTHSIEAGQIGEGILLKLQNRHANDPEILSWLPDRTLVDAACCAHDLGHPPYGHGGERALQECMLGHGGFESNAQTLRILVKLEKYWKYQGLNPTRRTVLSILKYPVCYEDYEESRYSEHPPKCYYATERELIEWALEPFSSGDRRLFVARNAKDKPLHRSLDASLMECADDIAYAVHDLEDVVARHLVTRLDLEKRLDDLFPQPQVGPSDKGVSRDGFVNSLFDQGSDVRKQFIGRLVNLFVTEATIRVQEQQEQFEHPLLRMRVGFDSLLANFLERLKSVTYDLGQSGRSPATRAAWATSDQVSLLRVEFKPRTPDPNGGLGKLGPERHQGTPRLRLHSGHDGSLCGEDLSSALHSRNRYQPR